MNRLMMLGFMIGFVATAAFAAEFSKPYSGSRTERVNVFAFSEEPVVKLVGNDKYEITFATTGYCDVTVGIIDKKGVVVRHLGSGVLGSNAPKPFQKSSLKQTIYWNGKDDMEAYHKKPESLRVQVSLGLKPTFDKRLGGTSPKNLPGRVWGIAINSSGAYVFLYGGGFSHMSVRKFNLDGTYNRALFPPPANMPREKLTGTGYVEFEAGKRAWHGPNRYDALEDNGLAFARAVNYKAAEDCQMAIASDKLIFLNAGNYRDSRTSNSKLFYIGTDGSTDVKGMNGCAFAWGSHLNPIMAVSPDGKWVYMGAGIGGNNNYTFDQAIIVRAPADGRSKASVFIGKKGKIGGDDVHLNTPTGIDCDAQGRIYVSDYRNFRIQIFSPEGKFLKSIKVRNPRLLRVHQKTGAIYVQHTARLRGKSFSRLTKFTSFDDPTEAFHVDHIQSKVMTLDSWSKNPRLWLGKSYALNKHNRVALQYNLRIYEERGATLQQVSDFSAEAKKEDGKNYMGLWQADVYDWVNCDPVREQVYYRKDHIFDLKSGKRLGRFKTRAIRGNMASFDDIAFDKRGYMHLHFNPLILGQGIGRVDPGRPRKVKEPVPLYPEVPYDYGLEALGWKGIIRTKDQLGAKGFQDGLGVNMRGDIVSESNIYYIPKMEESGWALARQGPAERERRNEGGLGGTYIEFMKALQEKRKRGEDIYSIKRRPGIPLAEATVWTYDSTGELDKECAVIAGDLVNGVQMDEERSIYFVNSRPRLFGNKPFLHGKTGIINKGPGGYAFTGTLIKTRYGKECKIILSNAPIPMDPLPTRQPDLLDVNYMGSGEEKPCWVEGAEWLYAGASPIKSHGCACPRQHLGLDWYKRTLVPEVYRHSIGVLDTNGNLILHIGQYGNFDSASGPKSKVPVGGDGIGLMINRFISATDNYIVFGDWAERIVVLKVNYHAQKMVKIRKK